MRFPLRPHWMCRKGNLIFIEGNEKFLKRAFGRCPPAVIAGSDPEETTIDERPRIEYTVIVKNKGVSIKTYR